MRVIIAGSRSIGSYPIIERIIKDSKFLITEIVSGTAKGVDRLGEQYATKYGIPITQFPASWQKHGKAAGYLRNTQMADYADALILVWDGESRGSKHMLDIARAKHLKTYFRVIKGRSG